ncbi:hypothetical protein JNUCC0626_34900 [Lentzea sp. JNUCC 0626]|uniref:hypothetical protein n=1 Tax=Lentzea sp. JNUCC 0626 TaxID=3367513 RepID=UPI003748BC0E
MSEQEIREGMLLAVWDEPPLDFDPDTLIRRVEQKKSRRRALVAVGVATAMIAVVSFSLPGLLPRDQNAQLATDTPASASTAPSQNTQKKAERIGDLLVANLSSRMRNFKELYSSFGPGRNPYPINAIEPPPQWSSSDRDFSGYVYFTDDIGPTALRVSVTRDNFNLNTFCSGASYCRELQQKDGSVVTEAEYLQGTNEVQQAEVARKYESGVIVRISSYAVNPSNGLGMRATVPVRVGVLTDLVSEPSIAWE